jgi:DNA-binding MarR family transcriptional regulator
MDPRVEPEDDGSQAFPEDINMTENPITLFEKLIFTSQSMNATFNRALPKDITPSQFWVMRILDEQGARSQQMLCDKMVQTKGNMTMVIGNLVKKKWVMRAKDKNDRRAHLIMLTKAGKTELQVLMQLYEDTVSELLAPLHALGRKNLDSALEHLSVEA